MYIVSLRCFWLFMKASALTSLKKLVNTAYSLCSYFPYSAKIDWSTMSMRSYAQISRNGGRTALLLKTMIKLRIFNQALDESALQHKGIKLKVIFTTTKWTCPTYIGFTSMILSLFLITNVVIILRYVFCESRNNKTSKSYKYPLPNQHK